MPNDTFQIDGVIAKADRKLGLVVGWAAVCKVRGDDGVLRKYFDTQDDHLPDESMLKMANEFALSSRNNGEMHWTGPDGKKLAKGTILHDFPLTEQFAEALGITAPKTGWMVIAKPTPDVFAKFESGEYTGFSIGGKIRPGGRVEVEVELDDVVAES